MSDENTTEDVKGLDQFLKAFKRNPPKIRVGILGGGSSRTDGQSNAEIGAAHEYGTSRMPQRSFLRMPISTRLDKEMSSSNALSKEALEEVMRTGQLMPWAKKIAVLAEKCVLEAFSSNGFGTWAAWKGNYTSQTGNILVDSTQLRDSITSEVKE